ncbi:glycosyltransferase [Chitinasiproducens palmae]|uniref:Glycosyltransferase involved in cell wall bisynthesis n=1 Tax=Chitinasiproducens palmae TaxID=1770053 RepID=A0A1H2PTV1_9BURK|nr:glycosyltransferase [Chitinasiproducens palmae]SDV50540.1 Glycosyltransferase involved in cell wall bisynthesis [Chitinasiproducens palmae]
MKILHLSNHCLQAGDGIVNVMVDLACGQSKQGHRVLVATGGGEYVPHFEKHGVVHITLKQRPLPWYAVPRMFWQVLQLIRRERPDVVHAHVMTAVLSARFARLSQRFLLVATVHNEFQRSAVLMKFADRVVGVSHAVTEAMGRRGVRKSRLRTVCNGVVGSTRRRAAAVAGLEAATLLRPNVVTIAGAYPRKGIDVLIRAFARIADRLPDAQLYVIGDGPARRALEALAESLGLGRRVHFLGFRANTADYLAQTDTFALASLQEPFGLVLAEAREAGCAIVASDVGGTPEVLEHGRAGWLVPPGDVASLAHALGTLLEDGERRRALAAAARANLDWLSVDRMTHAYLDVYLDEYRGAGAGQRNAGGADPMVSLENVPASRHPVRPARR